MFEGLKIAVYSTDSTIGYWVQKNGTNTTPITTSIPDTFSSDNCTATKHEYLNGINNTSVVLYKIDDGGHTAPSPIERYSFPEVPLIRGKQNGDIEMAQEARNFFKNKSNPVLSIHESFNEKALLVFPNPASDYFIIDFIGNEKIEKIEVLNFLGQPVRSFNFSTNNFDLNGLSTGVYFVNIHIEGRTITKKLIKE